MRGRERQGKREEERESSEYCTGQENVKLLAQNFKK